jgi:hypothetical protein
MLIELTLPFLSMTKRVLSLPPRFRREPSVQRNRLPGLCSCYRLGAGTFRCHCEGRNDGWGSFFAAIDMDLSCCFIQCIQDGDQFSVADFIANIENGVIAQCVFCVAV